MQICNPIIIRSGFSSLLCHTAVRLFEQKILNLILSAKIIFLIYYSHICQCFGEKEISLKFSQIKETYRNQYYGIISWFDKLYFSWKHIGWNLVKFPRKFYGFYRCIYLKQNKLLRLFIYFLTLFFHLSCFTIRKNLKPGKFIILAILLIFNNFKLKYKFFNTNYFRV